MTRRSRTTRIRTAQIVQHDPTYSWPIVNPENLKWVVKVRENSYLSTGVDQSLGASFCGPAMFDTRAEAENYASKYGYTIQA